VVFNGKKPGVYTNWADCHDQVNQFRGASYKKYNTYDDAYAAFSSRINSNELLCDCDDLSSQKTSPPPTSFTTIENLFHNI